jgi:hypothetical protein
MIVRQPRYMYRNVRRLQFCLKNLLTYASKASYFNTLEANFFIILLVGVSLRLDNPYM